MVEKLALTYHQFSLELGSVLRELEEDPFEVLILKDSESVDCLGFQIVKLERNNKYYLPFFIAAELVRHGHAEWTQNIETKKNLLNRLASVFGSEQRSQVLSPPDNNSLSSLIMQLRQSFIQNSGGDLDQRLSQEFSNLVSQRLQKILVKLRIEGSRNLKKKLDPLEILLLNHLAILTQIYENFLQQQVSNSRDPNH